MGIVTFDTFKFVDRLEKAGVSRDQAAAIVEAQSEALSAALDTTLATKLDIEHLERKLVEHDGKFVLLQWMVGVVIALAVANFAKQFF